MGKASKWFSKMTTCIFGFKRVKKNAQNPSSCKENKQSPGDQILASSHHHLVPQWRYMLHKEQAREVAAAIAAAESAAASIAEAAVAIARARVSFSGDSKGGRGETVTGNAAAVKIQKTFRGYLVRKQLTQIGSDNIPVAGDHIVLPQRERLLKKRAQLAAAATKIQKIYRGHLARRALRALKSLVKVQALFRGRRVRKRVAAVCIQALIRARANVPVPVENVCRSPNYMSPTMSSKAKLRPAVNLKKEEQAVTEGKKQHYLLYVEKMASRYSFSDCDGIIHSRPSFSEVRLRKRSRSQS